MSTVFANLFDASPDAILLVGADGRIRLANPAVESLFGYPRQDLLGQPVEVLMPEGFRSRHIDHRLGYMDSPRTRPMSDQSELYGQTADGTVMPVDISLAPVGSGGDLHVIVIIRSAVERHVAASAAREREWLTEELAHTRKLEAIGRLAGGIAHDFNNLLTIINGNTDMLLAGGATRDDQQRMLDDIRRAGMRGASLTRQLLAFGRRQRLQPSIVDLNALLASVETMLARLIGPDIELRINRCADLSRIAVDEGQIENVLLNLASNARDAMPAGGTLSIDVRNLELLHPWKPSTLPVEVPPDSYVHLIVRDTGHGMSQATLERAFEPFFTTKERGQGTGLGLSGVYGIIKQSGGYVWLESKLGSGTAVNVVLPAARDRCPRPTPLHG
jgi:PAS domain S-box-containing protein